MKHTIFDPKTNRDVVVDRPDDWQPEVIQPKAPPKTKQELEKLVVEARDELFKDVDSALSELKETQTKEAVLNVTASEATEELMDLEEKLEASPPPSGQVRMVPITGIFEPVGFMLPSMDAPTFNIENFKAEPPKEKKE